MFKLAFALLPFILQTIMSGTGDSADNDDSDTGDATGKNGGDSSEEVFTKSQVEKMIEQRISRAKKTLVSEVESDLRKKWDDEQKRSQQEEAAEYKPLYETALEEKAAAEKAAQETVEKFRLRLAKVEIEKSAKDVRLAAPTLAYKLIDFDDIVFDDDNVPTNVDDLVKALAEANPDLVKPEDGSRNGIDPVPNRNGSRKNKSDRVASYLKQAGKAPAD